MENLDLGIFNVPNMDHINTPELEEMYEHVLIDLDNHFLDVRPLTEFIDFLEENKNVIIEKNIYFKYFELLDEKGELTGKFYTGTDYLNVNFRVVFRNAKVSEILNEIENNGLKGISFFLDHKYIGYNSNGLCINHFDIVNSIVYAHYRYNEFSLEKIEKFEPVVYVFNEKHVSDIFKNGLTHQELIKFINTYKINNPFVNIELKVGWIKYKNAIYERDLIEDIIEIELNTCDYLEFNCNTGDIFCIDYDYLNTNKWKIYDIN